MDFSIDYFLQTIDDLGFFKYANPSQIPSLKQSIQQGGPLFSSFTRRIYPFDYEHLAEGGVKSYLEELAPLLANEGLILNHIQQSSGSDEVSYYIEVNDRTFTLAPPMESIEYDPWWLVPARMTLLVNTLLDEIKTDGRLYQMWSSLSSGIMQIEDGDAACVVLTNSLYEEFMKFYQPKGSWEIIKILNEGDVQNF